MTTTRHNKASTLDPLADRSQLRQRRHTTTDHKSKQGEGNQRRLTGAHETAPFEQFSYGVANRGCSCRIPRTTEADGYGYFEDRRPASNMDPYIVTGMLVNTTVLN